MTMHYPRKLSRIKKIRRHGFRAKMRTKSGRAMLSRQRKRRKFGRNILQANKRR